MNDRERNLATVRRFYDEVVNGGNFDAVDALFAEDYVNHDAGPGAPADRESVKTTFRGMRSAFPDLYFDVQLLLSDGDYVFNRGIASGTQDGPFRSQAPTGKPVRFQEMHVYRLRDGLITDRWWVADLKAFYEQLGL